VSSDAAKPLAASQGERRVALVGSAESTRDLAPFDDPSWEIWGLAWRRYPRADRLFDIHDATHWAQQHDDDYYSGLAASGVSVYLRAPHPDIPTALVYPADLVREDLARGGSADFWTSSIAYMLALAIVELQPGDVVAIYGVDMALEDEYAYQRPACEYLIGLARGRGLIVEIPEQSTLCRANFVYGLAPGDGGLQRAVGLTPEVLRKRLAHYAAERRKAQDQLNAAIGRLNTLDGAEGEARAMLEYVEHFNRGGVLPAL
jgi:hypothetical protein